MLRRAAIPLLLLLVGNAAAAGDRLEELTRALIRDPSYKVRVQAAVVLGRLSDQRAVPALLQALHDDNDVVRGMAVQALALIGDQRALASLRAARSDASLFVRTSAEKVLPAFEATVKSPAPAPAAPAPNLRNARFYVTQHLTVRGAGVEAASRLEAAVARQLASLPMVVVRLPDPPGRRTSSIERVSDAPLAHAGAAPAVEPPVPPSAERLAALKLSGWIVDGSVTIQLSRTRQPAGPIVPQLECNLKSMLATFPAHAIKASSSVSFILPNVRRADDAGAIRQCLDSIAVQIAEDVGKTLAKR